MTTNLAPADHAMIADLATIEDLHERVAACRDPIAVLEADVVATRRLRDALIYAGEDRFFHAARRCRVRLDAAGKPTSRANAALCPGPYKGRGLCTRHHWQWHHAVPWGAGGLELASPPVPITRWRALAQEISGVSNYTFQRVGDLRMYPTEDGTWSADRAEATDQPGYWARESRTSRTVIELPMPPAYATEHMHWAAVGTAHRALMAGKAAVDAMKGIRLDALRAIMADEPSNVALMECSGFSEYYLGELRRGWRQKGLLPTWAAAG